MYCQNKIVHTVQAGDSLYKLSRQYKTTVTELILGNPGVNPYNLQIGMKLTVCPGDEYDMPENGEMDGNNENEGSHMPSANANQVLRDEMRRAWLSHVYWTRMYLMSADSGAKDLPQIEERLVETADEIADVFSRALPVSATRQLRNLLMEHISLAGEIIQALKSGRMDEYDALIKEWYGNANQIATLLGNQNPYFNNRETRNMMLNHLDLLREEIEHQLNGEYNQSIETFREIENQAIQMADFFATGLMAR